MVTKYLNQPLGMGIGDGLQGVIMDASFVVHPKLWIGAAIGAIGGIASSLIGGSAASDAAKEARRERERAWGGWWVAGCWGLGGGSCSLRA